MRYKALPPSIRYAPSPAMPPASPPDRPPHRSSRVRDWLATIPILLLAPALVLAFFPIRAAEATLDVRGTIAPGSTVKLVGTALPTQTKIQVLWDDSAKKMPTSRTDRSGALSVKMTVPSSAKIGEHLIAVVPYVNPANAGKGGGSGAASTAATTTAPAPLATLTVEVVEAPSPTATPDPTPAPTTKPTPDPTAPPTEAPTTAPTVAPTQAPTQAPTAAPTTPPTAAPTVAPTAAPTVAPTTAPTTAPTVVPTVAPTAVPTAQPSASPSAAPTPTSTPTATPTVAPTPAPTATPVSGGVTGLYGSGIAADTLANTQVGGTNGGGFNSRSAYRFRASTSSALTSIRIYVEDGSGYSGGNGGSLRISIQTDDGTSAHRPSVTALTSETIQPGNPIAQRFRLVTFASPTTLQAGDLYHIVFNNVDPSPTSNFVSINGLYVWDTVTPRQPSVSDLDWAQLLDQGSGWVERSKYTPILNLNYANGRTDGIGYMECWQTIQPAISGSARVREHFTVSGSDRRVSSVSVRLKRDSATTGTSPLTVRLETSGGTLVATGTIPASQFPLGTQVDGPGNHNAWGTATFASAVTLVAGQTYDLVLSAPSDTVFRAMAIREGVSYSFDPDTYYAEGVGQIDTGSGWRGFDQPGGTSGSSQGDVQFYFR